MHMHRYLLALGVLIGLARVAHAQDTTKANYPQAFVKRPLALPPGMLEVIAGGQSDFVGSGSTDEIRTKFDLRFAATSRILFAATTDMLVAPSGSFQVNDAFAYGEYNLAPAISVRAGGYMYVPRDAMGNIGDPKFGVRIGVPTKVKLGPNAAFLFTPIYSGQSGGSRLDVIGTLELQLVSQLAIFGSATFRDQDFKFETASMYAPVSGGLVLTPTRLFDVGAEFRVDDVSRGAGRDARWLLVWLAIRN